MTQQSLTSLKKLKPTVLRGRDLEIETSNVEVKELQKQKAILLQDIKKLGDVFFGLKKAKEETEKKFDDYSTGRVMALEFIAREVSDELKVRAEDISRQVKMVEDTRSGLKLVKIDLVKREELLGTEIETLNTRSNGLTEKEAFLVERQQGISKMQGKLGGKMSTISKKEKEVDVLLEKIQKDVSFFENKADKEREELLEAKSQLKEKDVDIKAREVAIDIRDKELTRRKTWIRNREAIVRMLIGNFGLDKDKIPKHLKK